MADLLRAIEDRRSRRKYVPERLPPSAAEVLETFIAGLGEKENLKMRLVLDNGKAFNGLRRSYGMFFGVRNYIALIGDDSDRLRLEKLGYYGQWLILHATALGLGTCWVGGTFDRKLCPVETEDGESIACAITVGKTPPKLSVRERLLHRLTHRTSKTAEQMYTADGPVPEWFLSGMNAAQKAPSAVNRQPVTFAYRDGAVTASAEDINAAGAALDLGIAKLHFELGAGGGAWAFGNGAAFTKSDP
ncbi:MAG: nitroreductase family protein [Oscillospiraceae bacterium]|nr:nitroreductase family protein [Oscillospiraceae bacterium]